MKAFHVVLVAVDSSEPAQHAADFAIRIAEGSRLIFVNAVDSSRIAALAMRTPLEDPEPVIDETAQDARQLVSDLTQKAKRAGVHATGLVVEGEPVDAILRAAEQLTADLIILASHGRSGFARAVMGSVAEGVARRSRIPVMFAPTGMGPDHPERHLHHIFQGL
ncbi:MAG TPA: universal stress protein [Candidatus Limnocylindria bacterium]|jgi:nucleotide-binding universal stress UspA family protein|nr:universal stress protein [Candidatus Limnocylindria bacterium]